MFQTKVVWLEEEHKIVPFIWHWIILWRSHKGQLQFFKWNPLFLITYSYSSSRELSKIL